MSSDDDVIASLNRQLKGMADENIAFWNGFKKAAERIVELEEENARLRAVIERLTADI